MYACVYGLVDVLGHMAAVCTISADAALQSHHHLTDESTYRRARTHIEHTHSEAKQAVTQHHTLSCDVQYAAELVIFQAPVVERTAQCMHIYTNVANKQKPDSSSRGCMCTHTDE